MDNSNLFSQTYNQIIAGALGNSQEYFQMLGDPKTFNWPQAPTGQMAPEAYQIMSGMPQWSPIGSYGSLDAAFVSAYRQVLSHITFKVSADRQNDLAKLQNNVTVAGTAYDKANSDMNQAYLAAKQNGGVVFAARYPGIADWLNSDAGKAFANGTDNAAKNLVLAQDLLLDLQRASMPQTLQAAVDALKVPTGDPASTVAPRGWTKVPDSDGIIRWQPSWTIDTVSQNWRAGLSSGSIGAFTVDLDAADHTSDMSKSWASASAGYDAVFWGISGSGGWEKLDLSTSDQSVKATISVQSSTTVKVDPGDWYDGGFMSDIAKGGGDGYTMSPPWTAKGNQGSSSLFGQYGLLATRVSELLVVRKPSFEVTMSSATFEQNKQKFEAAAGLRIGPFHFGGSGGHESDYEHSTSSGTTFTGGSTSDDPLILGVVVAFPGVNTP